MQIIYKLFFYTCLSVFIISCKKFVQVNESPNLITTDEIFSNDKSAISAVSGLYIQMRSLNLNMTNGGLSLFTGLASDEIYNTVSSTTADPFYKNTIPATNSIISVNFWSSAYRNIYQSDLIIQGLESATALTDSVKRQLLGEMKFVRSFYYFNMINLFGDVPLILTTDYNENATLGRTPRNQIMQQIVADLQESISLLSSDYPSLNRARPNKWTAVTLLARVYLYQKQWADAEMEASLILNAGIYSLNTNLNNVFLPSSNEIIWQLIRDAGNTSEGVTFIPSSASAKPTYALTNTLLNSFEANDQRKVNWTKSNTVNSQSYYYPYKYKVRTTTPVNEYEVMFRLAELYLIRAEARANQNNITGSQQDINTIRTRAGLPNTTANDVPSLLTSILHERQIELFTEWGNRWFDLKRNGLADQVLGPIKSPNWQTTDALFPIPQAELDHNPALVQNPGY